MHFIESISYTLGQYIFAGNSLWQYAIALTVFLGIWMGFRLLLFAVIHRIEQVAKKSATYLDDCVVAAIRALHAPFYASLALIFALRVLWVPGDLAMAATWVLIVILFAQIMKALSIGIDAGITLYVDALGEEHDADHTRTVLQLLKRGVLALGWVIGLLLLLSNLGVNVTSLIAGLGVGGIAIALALQSILGDIFSSFSIFIDKPFIVGDFIEVGEHSGIVQHIGLKTTRLQSQRGEEIVLANRELTNARVRNFRKLKKRRDIIVLSVPYGYTATALKRIPTLVRKAFENIKGANYGRCYMTSLSAHSIDFELMYHIDSPEYKDFMVARQALLLKIYTALGREGIEFAYPTQIVKMEKI